jgi:hypothetical protein
MDREERPNRGFAAPGYRDVAAPLSLGHASRHRSTNGAGAVREEYRSPYVRICPVQKARNRGIPTAVLPGQCGGGVVPNEERGGTRSEEAASKRSSAVDCTLKLTLEGRKVPFRVINGPSQAGPRNFCFPPHNRTPLDVNLRGVSSVLSSAISGTNHSP